MYIKRQHDNMTLKTVQMTLILLGAHHFKIHEINILNNKTLSIVIAMIMVYTTNNVLLEITESLYIAFMISPRYKKLLVKIGPRV